MRYWWEKGVRLPNALRLVPSEWESAVPVVVVPAERVERMVLVMWVAKKVDGVEVVLAWAQVPASEVVVGRRVCESRRLVPVEDGLAGDVAT